MVGVKKLALKGLSGDRCPHHEYEREPSSAVHDALKQELLGLLEKLGFSGCVTEYLVSEEGSGVRGSVDILCIRDGRRYVFEVKSYPLSGAVLGDLMQLLKYCGMVSKSQDGEVGCYLVYRGLSRIDGDRDWWVFVEVPLIRELPAAGIEGKYKPGLECFTCKYSESCPFSLRRLAEEVEQDPPAQPQFTRPPVDPYIKLYQEVLKTEWCIMRHGASCRDEVSVGGRRYSLPVYVAPGGLVLHRFDLALEPIHIVRAALKAMGTHKPQVGNAQVRVDKVLVEYGLLIERPCAASCVKREVKAEEKLALFGLNECGEDAVLEFLRLADLYATYEDAVYEKRKNAASLAGQDLVREMREILDESFSEVRTCYKTFHGEYMRLMRNTGPLPGMSRVLEGYVLPFIEDVIGDPSISTGSLREVLENMIRGAAGCGEGKVAKAVEALIGSLRNEAGEQISRITEFQRVGLERLLKAEEQRPFFFLMTAPPGSGKTIVFTLYALARVIRAKLCGGGGEKVVIMYPTKTLARQQLQLFVYILEELNRRLESLGIAVSVAIYDGDSGKGKQGESFRSLKCSGKGSGGELQWHGPGGGQGLSVWCCSPNLQDCKQYDWLSEDPNRADIIITNPYKLSSDILKASGWISGIGLLVFDEAHHYLTRDHADFTTALIHRLVLEKLSPYVAGNLSTDELLKKASAGLPDMVFSSATITSSGMPFSGSGNVDELTFRSIGGIKRISSASIPAADGISRLVLGDKLAEHYSKHEVDYYAVRSEGRRKLTLPAILFPVPEEAPSGAAEEAAVTTMIFSKAFRQVLSKIREYTLGMRDVSINAVLFIDNKENQQELYRHIVERLLGVEVSPADKLLVRPYVLVRLPSGAVDRQRISRRGCIVIGPLVANGQFDELDAYSHLSLYCNKQADLQQALHAAATGYRVAMGNATNQSAQAAGQTADQLICQLPQAQGPQQGAQIPCYRQAVDDAAEIISSRRNFDAVRDAVGRGGGSVGPMYMPILYHNAELDRKVRHKIEEILESNPDKWSLIISTSTLEMGVNLPTVGSVIQFGLPELPEVVVQRFGRGGRGKGVFYTTLGVLVPRNTGEDAALVDEDYAVQRLFGFKPAFLTARRNKERLEAIVMLAGFDAIYRATATRRGQTSEQGSDRTCSPAQAGVQERMRLSASFLGQQIDADQLAEVLVRICDACSRTGQSSTSTSGMSIKKLSEQILSDCQNQALKALSGLSPCASFIQYCGSLRDVLRGAAFIYIAASNCKDSLNRLQLSQLQQLGITMAEQVVSLNKQLESIIDHALEIFIHTATPASRGFLKCLRRALHLLPPYMPDPYVVETTVDVYEVRTSSSPPEELTSKGVREVYMTELPLKITDRE